MDGESLTGEARQWLFAAQRAMEILSKSYAGRIAYDGKTFSWKMVKCEHFGYRWVMIDESELEAKAREELSKHMSETKAEYLSKWALETIRRM